MKLVTPNRGRARKAAQTKRRKTGAKQAWLTRRKTENQQVKRRVKALEDEIAELRETVARLVNEAMHR